MFFVFPEDKAPAAGRRKVRRVKISVFFAALFLALFLAVGLIGFQESRSIKSVRELAEEIQSGRLPEFVENQKTLLNIENLRRLTEIAYSSPDRLARREARINARALAAESIFAFDKNFHDEALKISKDINSLARARDHVEILEKQVTETAAQYLVALDQLSARGAAPDGPRPIRRLFFDYSLNGRPAADEPRLDEFRRAHLETM
ncbi:MAG: hypothetical protein LBS31_01895, partial [Candidatus Adiutrix sp.]|nr:hypothetical protein [Candidatus Adiutrix sp.]